MSELQLLQNLIDRLTENAAATDLADLQEVLFQLADEIEIRLWDLHTAQPQVEH